MGYKKYTCALLAAAVIGLASCSGDDGSDGNDGATGPQGETGSQGETGAVGDSGTSLQIAVDKVYTQANDFRGLSYATYGDNAGKIYASGYVGIDDATRQVVIARFFADGTPDSTFGTEGFVELEATVEEGANDETSLGVAELQGGDVVAVVNAADANGDLSVYMFRLNADGTQVDGWGDATGKVEVVFGYADADNGTFPGAPADAPTDFVWDVQVDRSVNEDRVVVFGIGSASDGTRTDQDRYITRLVISDTGATTDDTFNGGSAFSFNVGTFADNQRRGIVQSDGKIVGAGYTNMGDGIRHHVMAIRLNTDGTFDDTFAGYSTETDLVAATPGLTVFNPFKVDGGFAEAYAVGIQESTSSYILAGYGGATAAGADSTLGYESYVAQDIVAFRTSTGTSESEDTSWGNSGHMVVQSEGKGFPTSEDRGRHLVVLPDGRTVIVGRFGGVPAAVVLDADGMPDTRIFGDGVIELPSDTISSQFFGAALSPDGSRVAMTTNGDDNGARLVVLKFAGDN